MANLTTVITLIFSTLMWQVAEASAQRAPDGEQPAETECEVKCRSLGYSISVTNSPTTGAAVVFQSMHISDVVRVEGIQNRFGTGALSNPPAGVSFTLIKKNARSSDFICNNRGERVLGDAYLVEEPAPDNWKNETLKVASWTELCGLDLTHWYFSTTKVNQRNPIPICAETSECNNLEPDERDGRSAWGKLRPAERKKWLAKQEAQFGGLPADQEGSSANDKHTWTEWLNRDSQGGSGDFESLADFLKAGKACENPVDIECRTSDGKNWQDTGQMYTCKPNVGGICKNADQSNSSRCLDYEVRFLCP